MNSVPCAKAYIFYKRHIQRAISITVGTIVPSSPLSFCAVIMEMLNGSPLTFWPGATEAGELFTQIFDCCLWVPQDGKHLICQVVSQRAVMGLRERRCMSRTSFPYIPSPPCQFNPTTTASPHMEQLSLSLFFCIFLSIRLPPSVHCQPPTQSNCAYDSQMHANLGR